MASATEKLDKCEVCAAVQAKYTCPKCEVRTCSLTCVNIHKKELECDGIRDKTKFVPLNSFTDLDLLSDYRLLEDLGRSAEKLQKDPSKKYTRQNNSLPVYLIKLKKAAYSRGVNLLFMPHNFSRHKENTTYFKYKDNELFWKVEFIFPQAENVKWSLERVPETKRISNLLEEILYSNPQEESKTEELLTKLQLLQNKLKFYRSCGIAGLKTLLKAEKVMKSNARFYDLDMTETLKENLENKTIIEFPTVYVVLKDHADMFEIIESDDEEIQNKQVKPWRKRKIDSTVENEPLKNQEQSEIKPDSSLNYFFSADISDSENELDDHCDKNKKNQELCIPDYNDLVRRNN